MTVPPVHPVLIVNSRSGGGKAVSNDLVTQCRARDIEAIPFEPDDDLTALAAAAIDDGADALGMAGGDGSQAAVAAVAAEHDVPFVCVPAGTRNHFALDLGIDRNDVVGALDAFVEGDERRIDLGRVNGRLFVNNVAMGLYGVVVQSAQYRDHKVRTVVEMLPELLGPDAEPFDLRFTGPGGRTFETAVLVLVSNSPYLFDPRPGKGTRANIDSGKLGVIAVTGPPPRGLAEWTTTMFRVDSDASVPLGIDGESVVMEPPLLFESSPKTLRVRVPARRSVRRPVPRRPGGRKGPSALPPDWQ
jgi:diacylglycerol kinase family enzyme